MAERSVVRELVTLLGFDIDETTLKTYELRIAEARKLLRRFAITAGIATAAVATIARRTARFGDNLVKTSNRLGLSIQALQEWRFVAERSGIAATTFDMAMQRFGRRAAEAARGTGEAVKALARLRVQTKDANGQVREMDELLDDALNALAAIESPLERNALAMKLFDSEGVRVVQMLQDGAEGMASLRQRFRDLGGAIDDQTAQLGVEAVDAWTDFTTAINGAIFAMGKELLPVITDALNFIAEWIAENQTLVKWIGWVTIGVIGLTAAIFAGLAVWKLWAAAIALVNAGLLLMIAKLAIIAALAAIFALLVEDVALFFRGGADTLTGRAINGLKQAIATAIEFWKSLITEYVTKTIPEDVRILVGHVFDMIVNLWDRFAERVKTGLREAIDFAIPDRVIEAIEWLAGGGREGATAEQQLMAARAQRFAQLNIPTPQEARAGLTNVSVTVNQMPGETGEGVANRVSEKLIGKGVVAPLVGLAP